MVKGSFAVLALAACSAALFAQQPRGLKEVPIYPGAARDDAALAADEEMTGDQRDPRELSRERVMYRSGASVEEIFAWYRQKLAAKPADPSLSPGALAPGSLRAPTYYAEGYDAGSFQDGSDPVTGKKTYDGAWMRDQLKAKRKPVDGAWLQGCEFRWSHADREGRSYELSVIVDDHTFDAYKGLAGDDLSGFMKKEYRQSSLIAVECVAMKSGGEMEGEESAADDAALASREAALRASPPTARDLGVPPYPGASLNVEASAGMSGDGTMAYVYLASDPPAKLVAFYEKATGKKAEPLDQGGSRIVLKGTGLFPERFLSVQPNTMFGGSAKTVLTVFRAEP